jgi:aryl-alcohol dehydrogenase-like predicted oxidoreductase
MEQRPLGRTGLSVSALGFGCGSVGGLLVRGDPSQQTAAVARALDAGVTYFDTAPSYGDGRSEENLGRVLSELGAWRHVVVGTKVRLQPSDLADPAGAVRRSCDASLRRLGRESVDLLQLHNPISDGEPAGAGAQAVTGSSTAIPLEVVAGPVADAMQRLVVRGLVRHVGITGLGRTAAVHAAVRTGRFATAQVYFNAVNPSAGFPRASGGEQDFEGLIGVASAAGVGVINIRVMAAGALSARPSRHANAGDPGPMLVEGAAYARDLERAEAIQALAAESGCEEPLELALRFAMGTLGISTVLVGYSDRLQLEDALKWAGRGPLSPDRASRVVQLARRPV